MKKKIYKCGLPFECHASQISGLLGNAKNSSNNNNNLKMSNSGDVR